MTRYDAYLTLHVVTAIIWLGAGFMSVMLSFKAQRSGDAAEGARLGEINKWLAPRLYIPASLAVLVFGLLMVIDGPWSFDTLWIVIGLAGFAITFLTGILFLEPESKRIDRAVAEHGPMSPEVGHYLRRITIVSRVDIVLLFAIVANMVIKPTGDDGWVLAGGALAFVVLAALAYRSVPKLDAPASAPVPATE